MQGKYYIRTRSMKEPVLVTKEEFDNFFRDINAYRRKQQRHSRCVCPENERLLCDMDCWSCPHRRDGDFVSLDAAVDNSDDAESFAESLPDPAPLIESIISDKEELAQLLTRLAEIMPEAQKIGELRLDGLSDEAISERIGIGRKTFLYRIKRAAKILSEEFPNLFDFFFPK